MLFHNVAHYGALFEKLIFIFTIMSPLTRLKKAPSVHNYGRIRDYENQQSAVGTTLLKCEI